MKAFTNVKPKKKSESSSTKEKVIKTFEKAEKKGQQNFKSDMKKAEGYDASRKEAAKPQHDGKGGYKTKTRDLAASRSYAGVAGASSHTEPARVKGLQQTGAYDAKPAVVGGTKKMLMKSKKNVSKSQASPQAKRSARKLY